LDAEKPLGPEIKRSLKTVHAVAANTDTWTDESGVSYCSLTLSFIDGDWEFKSHVIACMRLHGRHGRHTGKELSNFLIAAAKKFNLEKG